LNQISNGKSLAARAINQDNLALEKSHTFECNKQKALFRFDIPSGKGALGGNKAIKIRAHTSQYLDPIITPDGGSAPGTGRNP
jgi:hypothetical protein